MWTKTPRCLQVKVPLQHSCWGSSRSPAFLLEGAQTESRFHEPLQLSEMGGPGPCRRSGRRLSSHIPETEHWLCRPWLEVGFVTQAQLLPNRLPVGHHCEETRPNIIVVAHVLVLLLTPDQLCVDVLLSFCSDQVKREWRDLGQRRGRRRKNK